MHNYVIITDSTCDLSPSLVEIMQVEVIPMEFTIADKNYRNYPDNRDLDPADFYTKLRAGGMATTAQVTALTYTEVAKPFLNAGQDVLFLIFSSGLSGSFNSSRLAVEELLQKYPERTVRTVDSLAASMGEGLLVYHAAMRRLAGDSLNEVADWVEQNRNRLCHWFTVDDLHFLHRGGRVSGAAAVMGTMLGIKPVLHVDDEGHLIPMEKVRGRRQSLDALVQHLADTVAEGENETIFVSHGDCAEDADYVAEKLRGRFGIVHIETNFIGPVIGSHSGPGTVALFWLGSHK